MGVLITTNRNGFNTEIDLKKLLVNPGKFTFHSFETIIKKSSQLGNFMASIAINFMRILK